MVSSESGAFPCATRDGFQIRPRSGTEAAGIDSRGSRLAVPWHFSRAPLPFVYLPLADMPSSVIGWDGFEIHPTREHHVAVASNPGSGNILL